MAHYRVLTGNQDWSAEQLDPMYRLATRNKPIRLTVLMEALCPDCQLWIVEEFYPKVFKNFAEFINIEFVPFGNAKITNGTITCQHGSEECKINRFESCLIDVLQSQDHYVPFIYCIENQLQKWTPNQLHAFVQKKSGTNVSMYRLISQWEIVSIHNNALGNIWPDKHTFVPWIIVNGVSLRSKQVLINNLPYLLCDWYTGDKEIPFCSSQKKKGCSKNALRNYYLSM
ncbi:unnamed protein product [Angiostrongylus costaricensis]|uniref:GILT-like protein F37H8.5 n=1 Tax=Angiostrongylus costaricensis TaxID=334426 RepID=A0A0R3PRI4_ANGCS|nr:unnamed protein product [Angiostrongylus costaricensis]